VQRLAGLLAAIANVLVAGSATAGLTEATIFFDSEYQQISPISVIPVNGGTNDFFSALGVVNNFTDFNVNGITVQVPTSPPTTNILSTPVIVILEDGTSSPAYRFQTSFLTPTQLATQFPTGSYVISANNTGTGAHVSASINYTGNHFANVPTLSAGTYSALSGLDPDQPFTFNWTQFIPDTSINTPLEFFTIVNAASQSVVFSQTFLSNTITSITVPAGTLLPNTPYSEELIFSARIAETDPAMIMCMATGTTCPGRTEVAFETRTITDFTTGIAAVVPEPLRSPFSSLAFSRVLA